MSFSSNAFGWPYFGEDYINSTATTGTLSDTRKARVLLPPQVLNTTALNNSQTCLVDDPNHIVDDPTILVGSLTTPIMDIRAEIRIRH